MGRNNSNTALNTPAMEAVVHFRSVSSLSTKSDDTVTSASVAAARKGVRSIAESSPVSISVEDVSYARTPTKEHAPRHSFCASKLATSSRSANYSQNNLKLAILGDSGAGKTSFLTSLTTDKVPDTHAPTIYDKFNVSTQAVCGKKVSVTWCDTAGQEDFAHLRQLCYSQINAAVICFSVADRKSFDSVKDKWIDEVRCHCPNVPVILMGTMTDKREDGKPTQQLRTKSSKSVSTREGIKMAAYLKAVTYVECSAFDKESVHSVFNDAVVAALGLGPERLVAPAVQCTGCTIL